MPAATKKRRKKFLKKVKHTLCYPFFFGIIMCLRAILSIMPEKFIFFVMENLAVVVFLCARKERTKTLQNLRIAFKDEYSESEIYNLARDVFINLGRNMAEICLWKRLTLEKLKAKVTFKNLHYFYELAEKGTYGIVIAGHCGNWDLLPKALGCHNIFGTLLVRELRFKWLDRFFTKLRESDGYNVLYRTNSSRESIRILKNPDRFLAILPDQDIRTIEGIFVDFFGTPAYTPTGPVKLALTTKKPLIPIMFHRDEDDKYHHTAIAYPPIYPKGSKKDPETIKKYTQQWSKIIENHIREHPSQWVWMHKRWKTTPEKLMARKGSTQ